MAVAPMDMEYFARCAGAHTAVYADRLRLGSLLIAIRAVQQERH